MGEIIFRVEYCDKDCPYSKKFKKFEGKCFEITLNSITVCNKCKYQVIPDQNWICDNCGKEFDRLEKYYEYPAGPDKNDILKSPEVTPGVKAVPLICHIKKLCSKCNKKFPRTIPIHESKLKKTF